MASKRADGRYQVSKVVNDKRKYFYGNTKKEATEEMERYIRIHGHLDDYSESMTVYELARLWLTFKQHEVTASTLESYKDIIKRHILPSLSSIRAIDVTPATIRKLLNSISTTPSRTQQYVYTVLSAIYEQAVFDNFMPSNPCKKVKKPKIKKTRTIITLTKDEVQAFMEQITNHEHYTIFKLAFATGLRRSELLGLRWSDVDLKKGIVTVSQTVLKIGSTVTISETTKNASSRRSISIDKQTVIELSKHRLEVNKHRLGSSKWIDNDLVFPGQHGNPRYPDKLSQACKTYAKAIGRSDFTFHGIRHTHATLLLESGVNFKAIQARLGHSSFAITMDTYSHVTPLMEDAVIEKIESIF